MARNVGVQLLRGIAANIPTLLAGELYYATDTGALFIGTSGGNVQVNSGGSGNSTTAIVDLGTGFINEETTGKVTVTGQSWVTISSVIVAMVTEGQDHTADEIAAEDVQATLGNLVAGVGFDVVLSAPNGASGKFLVNIRG